MNHFESYTPPPERADPAADAEKAEIDAARSKVVFFEPTREDSEVPKPTEGLVDRMAVDLPNQDLVTLRAVAVSVDGAVPIVDEKVFDRLIQADSQDNTHAVPDVITVARSGREKAGEAFLAESLNLRGTVRRLPENIFNYSSFALKSMEGAVSTEDASKLRGAILVYDFHKLQPAPEYGPLGVKAADGQSINDALLKIYILPDTGYDPHAVVDDFDYDFLLE
jgi:hypothetical protein